MNYPFIFISAIAIIVLLLASFSSIKFAGRVFRKIIDLPYRESSSYAWWLSTAVMIAIATFLPAANVIFEGLDLWNESNKVRFIVTPTHNTYRPILITLSTILTISAAWFWLWYFAGGLMVKSLLNKSKAFLEMQLDNPIYFIARGIVTLMGMIILLPFYLQLLRHFLPSITISFYR